MTLAAVRSVNLQDEEHSVRDLMPKNLTPALSLGTRIPSFVHTNTRSSPNSQHNMSDVQSTHLASVPEDQPAASTSSLPPAAKAASELAVKTAIAESVPEKEEGEIVEDGSSSASKANGNGAIGADGAGMRTVFSDPANFNVVHPLYSKW